MDSPGVVDVFRAMRRAWALPKPPRSNTAVVISGIALTIAVVSFSYLAKHQLRFMVRGMGYTLSIVVVFLPLTIIGAMIGVAIQRRRNRPCLPFAFPLLVPLPGARMWKVQGEGTAYVSQWGNLIALIHRPGVDDLEAILDELDPAGTLCVDHEHGADRLGLELEGKDAAIGFLRRLSAPHTFALVLAVDEAAEKEIDVRLGQAHARTSFDPPQKWRAPILPTIDGVRALH